MYPDIEFNPCILGFDKANAFASASFTTAVTNGDIKIYTSDTTEQNDATKIFDSTATNCIAKFFLYEARDIKRWVYGVERTYGSGSITAPGSQVRI